MTTGQACSTPCCKNPARPEPRPGRPGRRITLCESCQRRPGKITPRSRADAMLRRARVRTKKKRLPPCDLTVQWIVDRLAAGCAATGWTFDLTLQARGKGHTHPLSPSIDRIDSSRGYTQDNCRVVLWAINGLKGCGDENTALQVARAFVQHAGRMSHPSYTPEVHLGGAT